ncbi:ABC transporter permease subunit [Brachybacterium hainanense]|uniref:ABC transporter permease subunit n=1 Tax=Brachybacterium hainanense TaxID=1541174 RepID=A0ABV6R6R6_9MICO
MSRIGCAARVLPLVLLVGAALAVGWPLLRILAEALASLRGGIAPGLGRTAAVSGALAAGATVLALLGGLAAALTARCLPPGPRRLLDVALLSLLLVPPYTAAAAVLALGGRGGLLHGILPPLLGARGMLAALVITLLPYPYAAARLAWRGVDPRLVDAVQVHGGGAGRVLRLVLLPPLRRPLAAACVLMLLTALADPSIPAVLRGRVPTLAHTAYLEVMAWGDEGTAALIAVLLALPALPLLLLVPSGPGAGLTEPWYGHGAGPALALPTSPLLHAARLLTLLVLAGIGALLAAAILRTAGAPGELLGQGAVLTLVSTLQHALLALLVAVPAGLGTALLASRGPRGLASVVDGAQLVLLVLPGTTLGLAVSLAYRLGTPTPLGILPPLVGGASLGSGSIAIVLVLAASTAPLVHVATRAARAQIPRSEEETARVLGIGRRRRLMRLVLPQAAPLVAVTAAAVLVRMMVSVTPVVLVAAPDAPMVPALALDLLDRAALAPVFVLTLLVALVIAVLALGAAAAGRLR